MKLIIIGGGIAGLSAAYDAAKAAESSLGATDQSPLRATGQLPLQITLLESGGRWGGKITTERIAFDDGQFIIEGGPDTFLATKPYATALCQELGLGERLHGTNPHNKNTYVLHRDQLQPLPDGLAMMIPTNVGAVLKTRLVSWLGKARMGLDFILPPRKNSAEDESMGAFVSRRLGREAYENLIEPLMSGIYAGDGDQLSLASTFPYLRDLEVKYGSLARGALEMHKQSIRANGRSSLQGSRSAFLTPTTGLAEIVEKLVENLSAKGVDLRLNTPVTSITRNTQDARWNVTLNNGDVLEADALILATPAYVSGKLLASFDPALASALGAIPYASTATVSLAYRESDLPRALDGYGYVIPRREGRRALACTWTSTKFPHRAPEGYALIRVFIGRAGQTLTPSPSPTERGESGGRDNTLLAIAREELQLTLGIRAEPLVSRVFFWENAMPQYNLGHPALLRRIETALAGHPGLALAGNGYRGIGIPDCIRSGQLAVEKIVEDRHIERSATPASP